MLKEYHSKLEIERRRHEDDLAQQVLDEIAGREKKKRFERYEHLRCAWNELTDKEKTTLRHEAIDATNSNFMRDRLKAKSDINTPTREILEYFENKCGNSV